MISVVIPVYNGARTLRACLDSVLDQTFKDYEVIVVDNNSTDPTKEIIREFQERDKRIRYVFEPKKGRGAARNTGECAVKGDIIIMTDSDCIVPDDWIESMTLPIIRGDQVAVQGTLSSLKNNYWTVEFRKERSHIISSKIRGEMIDLIDTGNFAIKKAILCQIGKTDRRICSGNDLDLLYRLSAEGHSAYLNHSTVSHHDPDTLPKIFRKFFVRGRWSELIARKYGFSSSRRLLKSLDYFIGICFKLITLNPSFIYFLVTGVAWRLGRTFGSIEKHKLKS